MQQLPTLMIIWAASETGGFETEDENTVLTEAVLAITLRYSRMRGGVDRVRAVEVLDANTK